MMCSRCLRLSAVGIFFDMADRRKPGKQCGGGTPHYLTGRYFLLCYGMKSSANYAERQPIGAIKMPKNVWVFSLGFVCMLLVMLVLVFRPDFCKLDLKFGTFELKASTTYEVRR